MKYRLVVLVSGNGSNLQTLIDWSNKLPIEIVGVISNRQCYALKRAKNNNIATFQIDNNNITREETDLIIGNIIEELRQDLIVLAGYMRVITNKLINRFDNIINIHPALPKTIPGKDAIEKAYDKFMKGEIDKTGVMVHRVIEEVDAGPVIDYIEVPIYKEDKLEDLKKRVQEVEKPLLLNSIMKVLYNNSNVGINKNIKNIKNIKSGIISGKVRDRFDIDYNLISFYISDRLSSFDYYICNIDGKGRLLNLINGWWMNRTKHIIDNHLLYINANYMICNKCSAIPLEIIIRGYITGNTRTSIWTNYNNGIRNYCGLDLPEGLKKNQKLKEPLITPTTKGINDELISRHEILDRKIVSENELDFIYNKTYELYELGSYLLKKKNLILVDTKYEFGRDINGNIILIDEIHTCDSSRIWKLDTYKERINNNMEPEKVDKDCIRDYIKNNNIDITKEIIIPDELKTKVFNTYKEYYDILSNGNFKENVKNNKVYLEDKDIENNLIINDYYNLFHKNIVIILSGSHTDEWFISKIRDNFYEHRIFTKEYVCSAHKETRNVLDIIEKYNNMDRNIIFITIAGRSNALSGIVACNTKYPVIACPPLKDKQDYNINIHSTLQMPSNTPTMTILDPVNVVLACKKIFNLN